MTLSGENGILIEASRLAGVVSLSQAHLGSVVSREASKGPHRKDVAVLSVRDPAGTIKDSSDALLRPITVGQLLGSEVLNATADRFGIRAARSHEGKQRPSCVDNTTAPLAVARHTIL